MTMNRNYQELANEKEILQMLGIKKDLLRRLRKQGLPFVKLSRTSRVYIAVEVLNGHYGATVAADVQAGYSGDCPIDDHLREELQAPAILGDVPQTNHTEVIGVS